MTHLRSAVTAAKTIKKILTFVLFKLTILVSKFRINLQPKKQNHLVNMKILTQTQKIKTFFQELSLLAMLLVFVLSSCGQGGSSQPDLSAIPHTEALPSTELSAEDQKKLQQASGKQIESINMADLQNMLAASTNKLYVYAFWHTACKTCISNIENLKEIAAKIGPDKMHVITLNAGDNSKKANLLIRTENIAFETYALKLNTDNWNKLLDENWDGSLPALFLVNKTEEIFLKYYKHMSVSELDAIIQTLII